MTPLQKSKLMQLIERYADRRKEWFDVEFPGDKATECHLKLNASFESIVDYVEELTEG